MSSSYVYARSTPGYRGWLMRALGIHLLEVSKFRRELVVRARWGEATLAWKLSAVAFGLALIDWRGDCEDGQRWSVCVTLPLVRAYLKMPEWLAPERSVPAPCGEHHTWGFRTRTDGSGLPDQLLLEWRSRHKFVDLPWHWEMVRRSILLKSGEWHHNYYPSGMLSRGESELPTYYEYHPYCNVLPDGTSQHATAKVHVTEFELRRRWLRWLPILARRRRSLGISFDQEMGREAGSWKGGVVGTSFDMVAGELPFQTLLRMERSERRL